MPCSGIRCTAEKPGQGPVPLRIATSNWSGGSKADSLALCAGLAVLSAPAPSQDAGSFPPGYTTAGTGDIHDFDYFEGAWTTHPVKVRYSWNKVDASRARWEQAFSYDDRTRETDWTADSVRTDAAKVCEASGSTRPRRAAVAN